MDTEGRRRGDALPLPRDPPRSPRPPGGRPGGPGGPAPGPPLLLGAGEPRQAAGAAGKELRRDSGGGRAPSLRLILTRPWPSSPLLPHLLSTPTPGGT